MGPLRAQETSSSKMSFPEPSLKDTIQGLPTFHRAIKDMKKCFNICSEKILHFGNPFELKWQRIRSWEKSLVFASSNRFYIFVYCYSTSFKFYLQKDGLVRGTALRTSINKAHTQKSISFQNILHLIFPVWICMEHNFTR